MRSFEYLVGALDQPIYPRGIGLSKKQEKIRPECPFRNCQTVRKRGPATLQEKAVGSEHKTGKVCPLCATLIKKKIEGGFPLQ
jgi:hypothetical protein